MANSKVTRKSVISTMVENFDSVAPILKWGEDEREVLVKALASLEKKNSSRGVNKSVETNAKVRAWLGDMLKAEPTHKFSIAELIALCESKGNSEWGAFTSNRVVGLVSPLVREGVLLKDKCEVNGKKGVTCYFVEE